LEFVARERLFLVLIHHLKFAMRLKSFDLPLRDCEWDDHLC
jgi:hypothetical protein